MTAVKVAFLDQPLYVMGEAGERFAAGVLRALREWTQLSTSDLHIDVRNPRLRRFGRALPMIEFPDSYIFAFGDEALADIQVCSISLDGIHASALKTLAALATADAVRPALEIGLDVVDPSIVTTLSHALFDFGPSAARPHFRWNRDGRLALDVPDRLEIGALEIGRTWATGQARTKFRDLMKSAQIQPQLVSREDGDVVVVAKSYLDELRQPSSGHATMRWFKERALDVEGLHRPLAQAPSAIGRLPDLP